MKNKKSLIAILTLLIIIVVGVTFAYFNTISTFVNRFDLGDYVVTTTEVFESPDNWAPGDTTPKTLVTTNEGTINAAVRVSISESWTDSDGQVVDSNDIPADAVIINFTTPSKWTKVGDYYYYNYYLKAGESTTSLTDSVTLNSNLGTTNCVEENGVESCTANIDGLAGYHYTLTFTIQTAQYDKYKEIWNTNVAITEKPDLIQIMNSERTKDTLQLGDEVCINGDTTECFNFIRYDGNNNQNMVLLSKYNLKVGNIYSAGGSDATKIGEYPTDVEGYGLQSSEARGYVSGEQRYGTISFSYISYWSDSGGLKQKYGSDYPADVYDTDYNEASGYNYSLAYHIENYKDVLETYGLTVQSARLLTYNEAITNIGCNIGSKSCPDNFIRNTTFWLGTAQSMYAVYYINTTGYFGGGNRYGFGNYYGIRPVIVISKSEI